MYAHTIGADPELFVCTDKEISSAIGHIGGSKNAPQMVRDYGLQEDNVLAEFSMPALSTAFGPKKFSETVAGGITTIQERLRPANLTTADITSHRYSPEALKSYGPSALEFGCDPDFNGYTGGMNPRPDPTTTLRTAGGHVHVGYCGPRCPEADMMLVRAMDLLLGVPSVLLDPDTERRALYGKAGAYRSKPYGIEYRTLSNFWIHTDALRCWVWAQVVQAGKLARTVNLLSADFERIQQCINTSDKTLAEELVRKYNITLPEA